ncbi:77 kDa echinoderm microtubule-associated protein-like isoform X3 [Anneissia japonica]|uniref:77 kDa echinoderm microtubule-associated protein-like isoform X3 n=1 Tax=Anneissia japonica TaxID=1529436 RepID=UPI0014258CBF|nr:77 kDa echinoderm microtubule-associated protein-like isoform X3 [Anneissia japonica]
MEAMDTEQGAGDVVENTSAEKIDDLLYTTNDYGLDVLERVTELEKKVKEQGDELMCMRTAMADVVRRLGEVESKKETRKNTPRGGSAPMRAVKDSSGMLNQTLPSKPSVPNGTSRASHRRPPTPDSKRRSFGGGYSSSSSDKLKRWSSADSGSFPAGSAKKSSSLTNLTGRRSSASGPNKDAEFNADEGLVRIYMRGRPITVYVPSDIENFDISSKVAAPAEKLKIEWMYGYRGRDCRSNLHLLPTGEIVYFMAATVVLFNVEEGLQRHYMGHNDDVRCIAVHPDKVTIATGQVAGHDKTEGKPHVRVWDSVTLNTLHVIGLGTFDRAVCCVGFSKFDGGNTLVAVDEANDHCMSVWDWSREKKLCESKTIQEPVLAAEFHPLSSNQIITCGKSHIYFWTMDDGKLTKKSGIFEKHDKPKYVLCIAFADNGDVISGDSNGNIYIWGKGNSRIQYAVTGCHEGPIFSLCTLKDGSVLSGGGKDRKIKQWDRNYSSTSETVIPEATGPVRVLCQGKGEDIYVGTTRNAILHGDIGGDFVPIVQAHTDELWGLAVHPTQALFLTCGHDKSIIMWDSETHRPLWTKTIDDSCQSAHFHPSGEVFAIGTTTGRWIALDTQSRDLVTVHTDGNEQHDIVRYSPDGNYIAIGSHDNYIYVYAVSENGRKYSKVGKCSGHSSYVTHLDWSADSTSLQSNSGDYEILFWTAATCKQITSSSSMKDTEWATYTCTLGFPVTGIWPEGSDGTDINSVARNNNSTILATGDDFGKVNLFKYPSSRPKSSCNSFSGHSSHVTAVQFFNDNSKLISTGGKDMSCIQWKVEPF